MVHFISDGNGGFYQRNEGPGCFARLFMHIFLILAMIYGVADYFETGKTDDDTLNQWTTEERQAVIDAKEYLDSKFYEIVK